MREGNKIGLPTGNVKNFEGLLSSSVIVCTLYTDEMILRKNCCCIDHSSLSSHRIKYEHDFFNE